MWVRRQGLELGRAGAQGSGWTGFSKVCVRKGGGWPQSLSFTAVFASPRHWKATPFWMTSPAERCLAFHRARRAHLSDLGRSIDWGEGKSESDTFVCDLE